MWLIEVNYLWNQIFKNQILMKKKISIKSLLTLFCHFLLSDLICLLLLLLFTCGSIQFLAHQSHKFSFLQSFSTNTQPTIHVNPYKTLWTIPKFHPSNFPFAPNKSQEFYCTFMFPSTNIVISSSFPVSVFFHYLRIQ